jgi:hypothetical protein
MAGEKLDLRTCKMVPWIPPWRKPNPLSASEEWDPNAPKAQRPNSPTSSSSSTAEPSGSKGPAWPADFSQDVPEYSDEELDREMELVAAESKARAGK